MKNGFVTAEAEADGRVVGEWGWHRERQSWPWWRMPASGASEPRQEGLSLSSVEAI